MTEPAVGTVWRSRQGRGVTVLVIAVYTSRDGRQRMVKTQNPRSLNSRTVAYFLHHYLPVESGGVAS